MKEDWTEQLRRKLEGHEMPPPEGLWESISEQMDKPSGLRPHSRLTGTAQRWWAAAAAVLALMGFYALYNGNDDEQPLQANAVSQQQVSEQTSAQHQSIAIVHHHNAVTPTTSKPQEETLEATSVEEELLTEAESHPSEAESHPTEAEQHEDQPIEHEQKPAPKTPANPVIPATYESPDTYEASAPQKKWSVGINASGGLLAANTSQHIDRMYVNYVAISSSGSYHDFAETAFSSPTYSPIVKHHLPLRFGLSLQYQLNNRLSLLSGLNYTYLYSEFSIPIDESTSYEQRLHYLGLPVGLSWQLLRASRFHLYLAGGVMMEKCLNEKPWQWSVNGAAGAEYAIASQLGVYLEPSLGYYFSDGTMFEHYYKEHPLAPSIELGLRLHVGK